MLYWDDIRVGQFFEAGPRSIEQDEIIAFAEKYDPQYFHTDPDGAKQSQFGGLIASGWQTAAIGHKLMCEAFLDHIAGMGSPGLDQLRWLKPVRPGDALRIRVEIVDSWPSRSRQNMGMLRHKVELFNQNDERVYAMDSLGMFERRQR